jgi:hypothetical protein
MGYSSIVQRSRVILSTLLCAILVSVGGLQATTAQATQALTVEGVQFTWPNEVYAPQSLEESANSFLEVSYANKSGFDFYYVGYSMNQPSGDVFPVFNLKVGVKNMSTGVLAGKMSFMYFLNFTGPGSYPITLCTKKALETPEVCGKSRVTFVTTKPASPKVSALPTANALATPGSKCLKAGVKQTYKGKIYTCIKLGSKLYWNNGVLVKPTTPSTQAKSPLSGTVSQQNAVRKAESYLRSSAFSRSGLISQLEFSGFNSADATYAADSLGTNWSNQAIKKAESYLRSSAFSRSGLISQLKFSGFSEADATLGTDAQKANWNEQAALKAASYLRSSAFSRVSLIAQLEFSGFTKAEAEYGASKAGL